VTSSDESPIVNRLLPASWRSSSHRGLALFGTFVSIDLRRPASWISLAMGGWLGWWCCTRPAADGGIGFVSAAVLAVAAIGDIPAAVFVPAGCGRLALWCSGWACERAAWPIVGAMLGMLTAGGETAPVEVVPAVMVGALLATVTTVASRLSGAKAADAASLTLLLAAASAAAGGELAPRLGGSCVAAVMVWLLLGGLGWAWWRSQRAAIETLLPGSHRAGHVAGADVLHIDALPANGPLRQTMTRLAMIAALAAMAGWLVLEPEGQGDRFTQVHHAAVAWALFTAAWFVGLALPQAILQDGMAGAGGWDLLFRTAAGPRREAATSRRIFVGPRAGPVRFAGGVALSQAAILGWPVLVCAGLSLPSPAAARLPLGIVLGLAAAASVVTVIVLSGTAMKATRETVFAIAIAVVVGLLVLTADSTSFARGQTRPVQPASPSLPSLVP